MRGGMGKGWFGASLLLGLLAGGAAGAQAPRSVDLPGCYVGAEPCLSPAHMAALIARCSRDPALCGTLEAPAPRRVAAAAPARVGEPVAASPAPPTAPAPPGLPASPAPRMPVAAAGAGIAEPPGVAAEPRVTELVRRLPLPPSARAVTDRLPPDPAGVERALGLRRAEGGRLVDLRAMAGVPTVAEILRALRAEGG